MTQREKELEAKGYQYYSGERYHENAKEVAQRLRKNGWRATVLTEQRQGIPHYSVWFKRTPLGGSEKIEV